MPKRTQRTLTITLLDLKNAFGEVHHELIKQSLSYHHVPDPIINMFTSIYDQSKIKVAVNGDCTKPITVQKGVLQGDPCSPLLFNVCFNLLMTTLAQPKYRGLGYIWGTGKTVCFRAWMQFADDAVVISSSEKNAQTLLQVFNAWCVWANMIVRVDKCITFGMKKESTGVYAQYCPKLAVGEEQIPAVKNDNISNILASCLVST